MSVSVETYATLAEADAARGDDGRYIAGGTLVMRDLNYREAGLSRVLRVATPPCAIRLEDGRVHIGSGLTMAAVESAAELDFLAPVARSIGGPAVRNVATVGGNLFAPHPYGDFAVALLALDGELSFADGRSQTLADFFRQRQRAPLVQSVSIRVPRREEFRFRKISRVRPKGVSTMSIAAWLPGARSRIAQARIAFGAMGPHPLRAMAAERALQGQTLDGQGVAPALQLATQDLEPPDDALASAWYRREVAAVHLRRTLLDEDPQQ